MAVCGWRSCRHSRCKMKSLWVRLGPRLMGSVPRRLLKLGRDTAACNCCEGDVQRDLIKSTGAAVAIKHRIATRAWGAVCLLLAATQMETLCCQLLSRAESREEREYERSCTQEDGEEKEEGYEAVTSACTWEDLASQFNEAQLLILDHFPARAIQINLNILSRHRMCREPERMCVISCRCAQGCLFPLSLVRTH